MIKTVSFKNSNQLNLVGTLHTAPSKAIVIMAHGSCSNRFSQGIFVKISSMLCQMGYNVLTFDFSGHGESDDDVISLKKASDDVKAAIAYVMEQGYNRIALFGHSLGAYACLNAYCTSVETMVLIGALTGPVDWNWEEMCTDEQLREIQTKGYITNPVHDGLRAVVQVDANLLRDILTIDQKSLFSKLSCPILIVHGDSDQQEIDLLAISKIGLSFAPQGSQLRVIKGASHYFVEHVDELGYLTKKWLTTHFALI